MEGESTRQQKVGKQLQRDLAEIIREKGMAAFNGAMVSVTAVKVSTDLSLARVHLSIFPSAKAAEVLEIVNSAARELRYELGTRVGKQLRIVPELAFFIDDSLDYVERIDELLKK
ncbi:MAG: 30S ribosome-binding factor RbfA [Bacteroidales bacterium]|jgi:ribosome-binding factor A|nr:30S ribosome-binding factor RbfA [Bacteroidales bacterium]MDD3272564.1 30S ribosome-binding factor RbfA [Bacteroidales bacterium]MDD4057687.1 30S ribosome-binding factor RbfA [Bacteroidales bacterium]